MPWGMIGALHYAIRDMAKRWKEEKKELKEKHGLTDEDFEECDKLDSELPVVEKPEEN